MSNYVNTQADMSIYTLLKDQLGTDSSIVLLTDLLNKAYNQGRLDLAKELSPKIKARHGIFTRYRTKGIEYIEGLTEGKVILEKRTSKHDYMIKTIDEEYRLHNFSESSRGNRMHYAHVDNDSVHTEQDVEIVDCVVKPTLAVVYQMYDEGEEYDVNDHLIYF